MSIEIKATGRMLAEIHADLARPHPFAHERVGFLTCGIVDDRGSLLLLARDYRPVEDDDYLRDPNVGAMIGPNAMRKALQFAYAARSALIHVHSHGGHGVPGFSSVDLRENQKFIPSFFNLLPQMPHGAVVLSGDSACGQLWLNANRAPIPISKFRSLGAPMRKFGGAYELA